MYMDMRISGSGQIGAGEYEKVRISGSGRLNGLVRCESFHASGSAHGEEIECKKEFHVSGSCGFDKKVKAESLSASGSFSCDGDVAVTEKMSCSGSIRVKGSVKCGTLSVSGSTSVGGDLEAEVVNVGGKLNCGGLLNAEEITIKFDRSMDIGSIGGSKITIYKDSRIKRTIRLPLLSSLIQDAGGTVRVQNSIEGDCIALESVSAQSVSGRIVAIGADCKIDLVQYSEQVEISPEAVVGKVEKV